MDDREHVENLARNEWYLDVDELRARRRECWRLLDQFNFARADEDDVRESAVRALLGTMGSGVRIVPRFQCTYGKNIHLGDGAFSNANAFLMDDATITIGTDTRIGPSAQLMTALHPIEDHEMRREGWEKALPITIGTNVWLGASVTVTPGVTIGDNAVVGAGSVVHKDVPANTMVAGVPAKVIRTIG